MGKGLILALALLWLPTAAHAARYGPDLPDAPPAEAVYTPEQIAQADDQWRKDTRDAWRWLVASEVLNAGDVISSCAVFARGGYEANPIYGRDIGCAKLAAIKGGLGVLQFIFARNAIRDNPAKAKKYLRIYALVQGGIVGWNIRQVF